MSPTLQLLRKDFLLLARSRALVTGVTFFALVLVVVASFSFRAIGVSEFQLRAVLPGVLWMTMLFVSTILLHELFLPERQQSALKGLLLARADGGVLYFTKLFVGLSFLLVVQTGIFIVAQLLFGLPLPVTAWIILALGAVGMTALGTLLAGVSTASRSREILFPILFFPLLLPQGGIGVELLRQALLGEAIDIFGFFPLFLFGSDVIFVALGYVLFEFVIRE